MIKSTLAAESDDELDDDEREALRAFEAEGFDEDIVQKEEVRIKQVARIGLNHPWQMLWELHEPVGLGTAVVLTPSYHPGHLL